jgi:hypothetical protein
MNTTWTEHDSDQLTASMVMLDGHHITLTNTERVEAIKIGVEHGMSRARIATRLNMNPNHLATWARRHGAPVPPPPQPEYWSSIVWASDRPEARRAERQRAKQRQNA